MKHFFTLCFVFLCIYCNAQEVNNSFETATPITVRSVTNGKVNANDQTHFYKTVLPADGTLKIYLEATNNSGGNSNIQIFGYDNRKGSVLTKYNNNNGSTNLAPGATSYDTLTVYGIAADTFYLQIYGLTAYSYSFSYDIIDTSENDVEPNNTFETALPINILQQKKGHNGYRKSGVLDATDFYKTVLPADGTLKIYLQATNNSGGNNNILISGYDKRKETGTVLQNYNNNNGSTNLAPGATSYDTLTVYGIAADTFYFQIFGLTAYSYSFSYDIIDTSENDVEPNNTFETALLINSLQEKKGHTGYTNGLRDNNDYYKIAVRAKGKVKISFEAKNTYNRNGFVYLVAYDKPKEAGKIFERGINVFADSTVVNTITLDCLNYDTLYFRWGSGDASFRYKLKAEAINAQPVADMQYERLGNEIGFRPELSNATSFNWSFGDGTTSTLKYPLKTYKPGKYVARLIVTNSVCNYKDTAQRVFEIKGVEYYTPDSSGSGGDVVMKIFGGGLDTSTQVILKKGSTVLTPVSKVPIDVNNKLDAIFNFHDADEGVCDVIIRIPGEPELAYAKGFKINAFKYPYTWSEIVGPSRWRINVDNKFKLVVGNRGNVNAAGVLVAMIWPKTVNLKFDTKWFKPPTSGNYSIKTNDTTFNFKWEDIRQFYDDTFNTTTAIDTFAGRPYNGYMRLILIPKIAPYSTYEIPLIVRSTQSAQQNFITYTFKPNIWGSGASGSWMDVSENVAVESIDLLDKAIGAVPVLNKSPVKWLAKATKGTTQHMANLGQAMGAFYNYATGVTNSIQESLPADYMQNVHAGNVQVGQAILEETVEALVQRGANNLMKGQTDNLNKWLANNPNASMSSYQFAIDNLNNINDIRDLVKDLYKTGKDSKDLYDKLNRLQQLVKDCPDLKKQLEDLKKELDKDMNQREPKENKTKSVTSLDPNAIYGPTGQGDDRYVNRRDRQHFLVTFENVDSATAAAQIVKVVDTLNKAMFDLSTFEFGDVTVGTRTFTVPKGRKEFVMEQSLAPQQNMNVRINAQLDTATGIVTWQFTAIDPVTKDIPVLEGFLPPNVNKPQGEGSGSYTVNPRETLADETVMTNRASIIFDYNEPILTDTWQNIVDVLPPVSSVSATVTSIDSIIHLQFNGSDAKSGVGYHNLFVSQNGGEWFAFGGAVTDTLSLKGELGTTYNFYTAADDKVGNAELKTPQAETTVTLLNALNITLGNITALNVGDRNQIDWNTLTEDVGDYFVVERSSNGVNFTPFNTVKAKGIASTYQVFDDHPTSGKNYYRLRTYDKDGKFKLSKVVSAIVNKSGMFVVEAYPNPVSEILTVNIHGTIEGTATISVTNVQGLQVQKTSVTRNNLFINLSQVAKGTYFIKYNDSKHSEVIKVIKN